MKINHHRLRLLGSVLLFGVAILLESVFFWPLIMILYLSFDLGLISGFMFGLTRDLFLGYSGLGKGSIVFMSIWVFKKLSSRWIDWDVWVYRLLLVGVGIGALFVFEKVFAWWWIAIGAAIGLLIWRIFR